VRYYKIKTYLTLFGEYLLIREWGGIDNKNATGKKQSYYATLGETVISIEKTITSKIKKGYRKYT
jgi:predicted DNA-binding WGR domain protein